MITEMLLRNESANGYRIIGNAISFKVYVVLKRIGLEDWFKLAGVDSVTVLHNSCIRLPPSILREAHGNRVHRRATIIRLGVYCCFRPDYAKVSDCVNGKYGPVGANLPYLGLYGVWHYFSLQCHTSNPRLNIRLWAGYSSFEVFLRQFIWFLQYILTAEPIARSLLGNSF